MKRAAIAAAVVVTVGLAVLVFTGGGHASFIAGATRLEVFLDDRPLAVIEKYESRRFDVPHGTHHLRAGKTEWRIEVNRWFDQVMPIDAQCFVAFDVTNLLYQLQGRTEEPAVFDNPVAGRFFDSEPFDMPERTWLELSQMPKKMGYAERASILKLVPCSKRDASDEELSDLAPRPLNFQF